MGFTSGVTVVWHGYIEGLCYPICDDRIYDMEQMFRILQIMWFRVQWGYWRRMNIAGGCVQGSCVQGSVYGYNVYR